MSSSSFAMPALKRARILDLLCAELPDDVVSCIDAFAVPRAVQFVAFAEKYGVVCPAEHMGEVVSIGYDDGEFDGSREWLCYSCSHVHRRFTWRLAARDYPSLPVGATVLTSYGRRVDVERVMAGRLCLVGNNLEVRLYMDIKRSSM